MGQATTSRERIEMLRDPRVAGATPNGERRLTHSVAGVAMLALLLSSCSRYSAVDPVFGRQRIPSQRTGGIGVSRNSTPAPPGPGYYDGNSNGLPSAPNSGNAPLTPPGGFGFSGSSASTSDSGGWNRPGVGGSVGGVSSGNPAAGIPARTGPDDPRPRPLDNYGPSNYDRGFPDSASPAGSTPPMGSPPGNSIPPRTSFPGAPSGADNWQPDGSIRSTSFERYEGASSSYLSRYSQTDPAAHTPSGVTQVSTSSVGEANSPTSTIDASATYGYEREYRWLKGRTEFSPANRRWKLRYIPISGKTDENGGSVVLEDSPLLRDVRPGEAVHVEGRIVGDGESGSFAPLYRVERLSRLQ